MSFRNKLKLYVLLLISFVFVFLSIAFAWFIVGNKHDVGDFPTGKIDFSLRVNGQMMTEPKITTDNIAFVDFRKDVINNQSQTLDIMAKRMEIAISKGEEDMDIRAHIKISEASDLEGLLFLIYSSDYLAENKPEYNIADGYHGLLMNIFEGTISEDNNVYRSKINAYNQEVLAWIYESDSNILNESKTELAFDIIIWGDYEYAYSNDSSNKDLPEFDPNGYLHLEYSLNIIIKAYQGYGKDKYEYEND